jgi:hypothetical protein
VEGLLYSWTGPITVVIYIGDPQELDDLDAEDGPIHLLRRDIQKSGHTRVDIHLVFGIAFTISASAPIHPHDTLFPINMLRNVAMALCRSPYVLGTDVDFLPSATLYPSLVSDSLWITELLSPPVRDPKSGMISRLANVLVIPAFEQLSTDGVESNDDSYLWDLNRLFRACLMGRIIPFHAKPVESIQGRVNRTRIHEWCSGLDSRDYHFQTTRVQGSTQFPKWLRSAMGNVLERGMDTLELVMTLRFLDHYEDNATHGTPE